MPFSVSRTSTGDVGAAETIARHRQAFGDDPVLARALDVGGEYAQRMRGEAHVWTAGVIAGLQHAVRTNSFEKFQAEFSKPIDEQSERLTTIRGLFRIKSAGGDVRVVYSPLDALTIAKENPGRQVVFFGIGFETTAPANAMTVKLAKQQGIPNFSLLVSHVLVPPAIRAIMDSPTRRVQGFLAAGHVCTVMGLSEYEPLVQEYQVPIVATGFEPLDVLEGIRRVVLQLEAGEAQLDNAYPRAVQPQGNPVAQQVVGEVFETCDRQWRGIGMIPQSGWRLNADYANYDAEKRFEVLDITTMESPLCRSGEVLQGLIKPNQCEAFGKQCTPRTPLGAPMVSSEGACAAYYQFRRLEVSA